MDDRKKEDMWIDYWTNWSTSGPITLLLGEDDDSINRMGDTEQYNTNNRLHSLSMLPSISSDSTH